MRRVRRIRRNLESLTPNREGRQRRSVLENELAAERESEWIDESEAQECPSCHGSRLNEVARHVRLQGHTIDNFTALSAEEAAGLLAKLRFRGTQKTIAAELCRRWSSGLHFMSNVGLGYLALGRSAKTLSGGEAQRIRLAAQLARICAVFFTCSMSRPSAFIRGTIFDFSRRSRP